MPNLPKQISRRKFIGKSLVAGGAAAGGVLTLAAGSGCSGNSGSTDQLISNAAAVSPQANIQYLDVSPEQVATYTDMDEAAITDYIKETKSFNLPLGSLVYQNADNQALVLAPGTANNALIRLGFVDLSSGQLSTVLAAALGFNEDFIIYDARASQTALVWVECNMVHGVWRVYTAPIIDGIITEDAAKAAVIVDQGDSLYEPPLVAAAEAKVYWTVMPDPTGAASQEDSLLKCADVTTNNGEIPVARTVYESPGRMITNPQVSGDILTFVPRVDADAVTYQLTALSTLDDTLRNVAILPQSLRVSDAIWLDTGFAFCIENNYDYAKGLEFFGTYFQLDQDRYLHVNKVPTQPPISIKSMSYVKSTKNIIGLDHDNGLAAIVATPADCATYGDVLAGAGQQNRLLTYTTVTSRIGQEKGVCQVRVFDVV